MWAKEPISLPPISHKKKPLLAIIITVAWLGLDWLSILSQPSGGDSEARAIKAAPKFSGHMQKVS